MSSSFKRKLEKALTKRKAKSARTGISPAAMIIAKSDEKRKLRKMNVTTAGLLGTEIKYYDTGLQATAIANVGDCTSGEFDPSATSMISTPVQGDGAQNRDGKRIMITSVHVRGVINQPPLVNQTALPTAVRVFVALVLDTQSNGVQMSSENCFTNPSGNSATASTPVRNLSFAKRFRVLREQIFQLPLQNAAYDGTNIEVGGPGVHFDWFKKVKIPVNFTATGTTADIANVQDNSLHIIAFTNSAAVPTITYNARIRFVG